MEITDILEILCYFGSLDAFIWFTSLDVCNKVVLCIRGYRWLGAFFHAGFPCLTLGHTLSQGNASLLAAPPPAPWNIQFNNPAGDLENLDEEGKSDAEYDILDFWNFLEGLELKVNVGEFSPHASHGQELSLSEEVIEWALKLLRQVGPHHNALYYTYITQILCSFRAQ